MFVNFLKQIYVIIQRRIQGGYGGSSPSWISELYAFFLGGGRPPPSQKEKEM